MARRIQLRRDTAANWSATNPTLAQGEIGFDLTNNKIKIGTGSTAWNSLPYFDDKETVLSNYAGHIVPSADNTYDLGAPDKQWRHVYTAGGSIYLDNIKLTNVNGKFTATKVINPGEENEEEDPDDSDATSEIRGGGSIAVGDGQGPSVENVTEILINGTITEIEPGLVGISVTGEGLPTVTIPATPKVLYKGLEASYGVVHSNGNSTELNVNKIVIHKPATTTVTIDPTSSNDDFQVSGLGSSDVLAMFVVYGDVNGAKPLADLQNFTRSVIDNVILVGGEAGVFRTVNGMKSAFYESYTTLAAAANGLHTNFQFYVSNSPTLNGGPTTVREGSGASFILADASPNPGYTFMGVANGGSNYLPGHKIKILGTDLGGTTPENDAIITVTAAPEGVITGAIVDGTAFATAPVLGWTVTGTNYNVGSGFTVASVANSGDSVSASNSGFNYVVGDVITLLGENIVGGTTPFNNITITVTGVGGAGEAYNFTVSGIAPVTIWPTNSIDDGGQDQYDTANYINTNLASEINYNNGDTVVDGTAAFGAGSTYSFVYDTAMFGLFVTGNSATSVSTSGNSGADGNSTTETGNVFGAAVPEQTFDNAVTHINILGGEGVDGIRFSDDTTLTSAEGVGRVKLTSPGNRRIEEVYGYKQVSVTARQTTNLTTTASRNATDEYRFWIDSTTTTIDTILNNTTAAGIWDTTTIEFSLDQVTWYKYAFNTTGSGDEIGYGVTLPQNNLNYSQGDTIYFRYGTGGEPVVWWDSADLPGGGTNFRGAIIKYHAYITDAGSMVGTIHIAKDSGDNNIFHTEVSSGGTDGENAILWHQDNENQIKYKRIDGESSTAKIQWTATVFYGSEVWD